MLAMLGGRLICRIAWLAGYATYAPCLDGYPGYATCLCMLIFYAAWLR
jgi:hypothetical protein